MKFCARVGCNELVPQGQRYCTKHANTYDREIRYTVDKQYSDFYHSKVWELIQPLVMQKYHGLCVYSLIIEHKVVKAGAVHHIVPIRDDWDRRLDMGNLIPISDSIHDGKVRQWYRDDKIRYEKLFFDCIRQWNDEFKTQGV